MDELEKRAVIEKVTDEQLGAAENTLMEEQENVNEGKLSIMPFVKVILSWMDDLVFYFAVFMLAMSFLLRPVVVDGGSMMNTLNDTDVLLITDFLYTPDYGDIVVVTPNEQNGKAIIKRVIGLSGDVISIDYGTNTVYRNGQALTEDYVRIDPVNGFGEHLDSTEYPYTVPEGSVFVMGDNRGRSSDSRQIGSLSCGKILGKVVVRVYHNTEEFGGSLFGMVD